ncbi:MAG: hypothetical protein AAFO07_32125, partial [Bacteroidota bacterium]
MSSIDSELFYLFDNQLYRHTNNESTKLTKIQPSKKDPLRRLYSDSDGDLWVVRNSTVQIWNPVNEKLYELEGLPAIINIIEFKPHFFLAHDFEKLLLVEKDPLNKRIKQVSIIQEDINLPANFLFDSKSKLVFLAQSDNQLRVFDTKQSIYEKKPLKNLGVVNGMFAEKNGKFIWLATNAGLYKYFPEDHDYIKEDIPSDKMNTILTNVVSDLEGNVWISSNNGIFRYQPDSKTVD